MAAGSTNASWRGGGMAAAAHAASVVEGDVAPADADAGGWSTETLSGDHGAASVKFYPEQSPYLRIGRHTAAEVSRMFCTNPLARGFRQEAPNFGYDIDDMVGYTGNDIDDMTSSEGR